MFRIESESGEVVAQLSVGEAEFWLADESPEHFNFSPESLGGGSVRIVMIVQDPDSAFERAVTAGATVVWPVAIRTIGASEESSIRSGTIGKSASPFLETRECRFWMERALDYNKKAKAST